MCPVFRSANALIAEYLSVITMACYCAAAYRKPSSDVSSRGGRLVTRQLEAGSRAVPALWRGLAAGMRCRAGGPRMHYLLRPYARQLTEEHAEPDGREQARDRLGPLGSLTAMSRCICQGQAGSG